MASFRVMYDWIPLTAGALFPFLLFPATSLLPVWQLAGVKKRPEPAPHQVACASVVSQKHQNRTQNPCFAARISEKAACRRKDAPFFLPSPLLPPPPPVPPLLISPPRGQLRTSHTPMLGTPLVSHSHGHSPCGSLQRALVVAEMCGLTCRAADSGASGAASPCR